jgi:hypothetical protein
MCIIDMWLATRTKRATAAIELVENSKYEKVYLTSPPIKGGLFYPQLWNRLFYPLNFSKLVKLPLDEFWATVSVQ